MRRCHVLWIGWMVGAMLLAGCGGGGGSSPDADVPGEAEDGDGMVPDDASIETETEAEDDAEDVPADGPDDDAPPVTVGTCEVCSGHVDCGAPSRCILLGTGTRACTPLCNPDVPTCPRGFHCEENEAAPGETTCVPIADVCCIDQDADGYGLGVDCRGLDCDDDLAEVNPGMVELCNELDDDCNGATDDDVTDCGVPECREDAAGTYEELPHGFCTGGACDPRSATPCGWFACWGGAGEGDACADDCAPLAVDDDVFCAPAAHCDGGLCLEDSADGLACDENSDCAAGHCGNGFCCSEGDCCAVVNDCPGAGTVVTTCDDAVTCQGSRGEAECVDHRCGTRAGLPDDSACDAAVEAGDCGPFTSVYCTGAADQTAPVCATTCSADVECDADAHCDGVCIPDLPEGNPCDENSDCLSAHCRNDVCCLAGDCCRGWADCPAWYGMPPVCDDPASCQGTRDAAVCINFQCTTQVNTADDRGCSSSTFALGCGLYLDLVCNGGEEQTPPVCATTCASDAECDPVAHCDEPACLADLSNGSACNEHSDCVSGHCQNGFCCAAGDCCAAAGDCPLAAYGLPPTCSSVPTCQGDRRDPVCNTDFQCVVGTSTADDSGCAGLTSNDCGAYPSVACSTAAVQPPDQASLCAASCTGDIDCDPGAHCTPALVCVTDGDTGDPCAETRECGSGLQCVDGVCCSSTCAGSCRACDVPGSEGVCTMIGAGTDPDGECAGFSCSTYYWGWSGDGCYDRAPAPDSAVACNGAGACQVPSAVCPITGQGSTTLACNSLCQDPRVGTCADTTAGICDNVSPSPPTATCGVGYCQVTVDRCLAGVPQVCTPLAPATETCNNIDDDCNTVVDDNIGGAADAGEPNNTCSSPSYVGTIAEANSEVSWQRTIYPSSDTADFYRFYAEEGTHACVPFSDQDYSIRVRVIPPSGVDCRDYDLYLYNDSCGEIMSSFLGGCVADTFTYTWDGSCGADDSRTFRVEVRPFGGAWECAPYTLYIDMWQV